MLPIAASSVGRRSRRPGTARSARSPPRPESGRSRATARAWPTMNAASRRSPAVRACSRARSSASERAPQRTARMSSSLRSRHALAEPEVVAGLLEDRDRRSRHLRDRQRRVLRAARRSCRTRARSVARDSSRRPLPPRPTRSGLLEHLVRAPAKSPVVIERARRARSGAPGGADGPPEAARPRETIRLAAAATSPPPTHRAATRRGRGARPRGPRAPSHSSPTGRAPRGTGTPARGGSRGSRRARSHARRSSARASPR